MGRTRTGDYAMHMRVVAAVSTVGALALAAVPVAAASGSSATSPSKIASVSVVGSGFLNWTVSVRSRPNRTAPTLKTLTQFRPDYRPRAVLALSELDDAKTGKPSWYRITVPGRPNGRTGWIPAGSVSLEPVDRWLVIYRGSRKFEFYVNGTVRRTGKV